MTDEQTSPKASRVLNFLRNHGIYIQVHHHPPVFTIREAQSFRGSVSGAHTKNLFLKDKKGSVFLISALENAVVDLKTIHASIGANGRLSFGPAALLQDILGVEPGAVSPLGLINDRKNQCKLVLDKGMFEYESINFHPLDNSMTVSISSNDLKRFLDATGHSPILIEFAYANSVHQ